MSMSVRLDNVSRSVHMDGSPLEFHNADITFDDLGMPSIADYGYFSISDEDAIHHASSPNEGCTNSGCTGPNNNC